MFPHFQETIFQEFNTLSVVYGQPEVEFVDESHRFVNKSAAATAAAAFGAASAFPGAPVGVPAPAVPGGFPGSAAPAAVAASVVDDPFFAPPPPAAAPAAPPAGRAAGPEVDLLGLDDFGFGAPAAAPAPVAAAPVWGLNPAASLDPPVFQAKWTTLAAGCVVCACACTRCCVYMGEGPTRLSM